MGVRGLKSFLEREKQVRPIKIGDEINEWKSVHRDETPLLVIDFYNLAFGVGSNNIYDTICAGGHQTVLNAWNKTLTALKATGSSLVFFVDLNVQEDKIAEWLRRRNKEFELYKQLYFAIENGTLLDYTRSADISSVLGSTLRAMIMMAKEFGDVHYSFRHECDLETARYATRHNALAIISSDTDFLIFAGRWRYWSAKDLHIDTLNQVKTIEFNRNGLAKICSLSQHQLPLLATLLTNDFTHDYFDRLRDFYNKLGPMKSVIENVASYVKRVGSAHLTDLDIRRLTQHVFGKADEKIQRLIRQSLNSYDLDYPDAVIDDPLEQKLLNTDVYDTYIYFMGNIQDIILGIYDMRDCKGETNFSALLIDWAKRKTGIVTKRNNEPYTFTLLTKKYFYEDYAIHKEEAIHPEFELLALDRLYIETESNGDSEIADIRWKILAFIMSLPGEVISALKKLPKKFLLISTALYALVKNELLEVDEADGILYTEYKVYSGDDMKVDYPDTYQSRFIRVAHIYNTSFANVCENFAIAGLLPKVQGSLQFDGVYFQKVMEKTSQLNAVERKSFFAHIKDYRIYANII